MIKGKQSRAFMEYSAGDGEESEPSGQGTALIMDESDSFEAAYRRGARESALAFWDWFDKSMRLVYGGNGDQLLRLDCFLLAHKKFRILGVKDQVKLAARWGVTKEAVQKIVGRFQKHLGIPGERSEEGRKNMKKSREAQLGS